MACAAGEASFTISLTSVAGPGTPQVATHNWVLPSANCSYVYSVSYSVQTEPNGTAHIISWTAPGFHYQNTSGGSPTVCGGSYPTTTGSGTDQTFSSSQTLGLSVEDGAGPGGVVCSGMTGSVTYTLINTIDNSACWTITGIRKNGRKWKKYNPNRAPSVIQIPRDVDPASCIVIEDGILIPQYRYELISE